MKARTMPLAFKYCVGKGVEIGAAAHNPFDLPDCQFVGPCNGVDYLFEEDMADYNIYKTEQLRNAGEITKIDILGDFQAIKAGDASFNYLISSHVIEHVPNLIAAFVESYRILKSSGVFFCIFPKRTATPTDAPRALTTLDKMIENYDNKVSMATTPKKHWRAHYQVFSLQSMIRAVNYINNAGLGNWLVECMEETDSKVGNGHTIVLRKYENLPEMKWEDENEFNDIINRLTDREKYETALGVVKGALSYNFFDPIKLFVATLLSCKLGHLHEGVEFLRQALILDPENERYRQEFVNLTRTAYVNPVL